MTLVEFPNESDRIWLKFEPDAAALLAKSGLGTAAIQAISNAMRETIAGIDFSLAVDVKCADSCRPAVEAAAHQMATGIHRVTSALLFAVMDSLVRVYMAGGELPGASRN